MKKFLFLSIALLLAVLNLYGQKKIDPLSPEAALEKFIKASLEGKSNIQYFLLSEKTREKLDTIIRDRIKEELNYREKIRDTKSKMKNLDSLEDEENDRKNKKKEPKKENKKEDKEAAEIRTMLSLKNFDLYKKAEKYFCKDSGYYANLLEFLQAAPVPKRAKKHTISKIDNQKTWALITMEVLDPAMITLCKEDKEDEGCGNKDDEAKTLVNVRLIKEKNEWKIDLSEKLKERKELNKKALEKLEELNDLEEKRK